VSKNDSLAKRSVAQEATDMIFTGGRIGGSQLVTEAMERLRHQYGETVLSFVVGQMDQMMRLKAQREELNGHINYVEQRIAAINEGLFTVSGYPPGIRFHEERLNDGL
jgi:hypothetical protein